MNDVTNNAKPREEISHLANLATPCIEYLDSHKMGTYTID